jgi:hypothetical protein
MPGRLDRCQALRPPASIRSRRRLKVTGHNLQATAVRRPKKSTETKNIRHDAQIQKLLKILGNQKLESLYYSICLLDLEPLTPLIGIGVWSFFETLTACAGRNPGVDFDSFLNKAKRASYGIQDKSLQGRLDHIRDYGNTTKHHPVAAIFNGEQMKASSRWHVKSASGL